MNAKLTAATAIATIGAALTAASLMDLGSALPLTAALAVGIAGIFGLLIALTASVPR
ncbi:hypothetical protein N806_20245 [Rhodococcus sp. P27]|nr:hypothetical protein N806_20245 [Rhodococcus sp. P27]